MASIQSLTSKISRDYPELKLVTSNRFVYTSSDCILRYDPDHPDGAALLLHELGHHIAGDTDKTTDMALLAAERRAWDIAESQLAPHYSVVIDSDVREECLDSYRDWLHARSLCPKCRINGFETKPSAYTCPACTHKWTANAAIHCGLRRRSASYPPTA